MFRILNVFNFVKSSRTPIGPNFRYYANKDVYKGANYNAPYEKEDLNLILKTLNESKSTEEINKYMAKNMAAKIFKHISQHGPFQKVENLLDVVGILPDNLEKICNRVIKTKAPKENQKYEKTEKKILPLYQQKKFTKVKPGIRHLKDKSINSIVGIKISLEGLAFAHIEAKEEFPEVISWNFVVPDNSLLNKSAFECLNLVKSVKKMAVEIPKSDAIVYEQLPNIRGRNDPMLNVLFKLQLMEVSFFSIIEELNPGVFIHSMHPGVINELYGLDINGERVNTNKKLELFMPEEEEKECDVTQLKFSQIILDEFEDKSLSFHSKKYNFPGFSRWKVDREMRSQALFIATGFRDLLISFQKDVEKKSEKSEQDSAQKSTK